ncbi:CRISPR associated protein [Helicobacter mustelae]|uniref:type II CRISPR RNA-guided endonuclease Cas9 n=1 Tax=Helicobacter mustelae TaxID=217 RepID=UPI000DFF2E59|nr:type II CRISPR RNA-guided endonuclease Cas9 [Helicobacter mustelae]STP11925.1 CRISPR associated protein [Helicobacter mustelae]
MIRTLGIDIGIASIGWAVIEGEYTDKGLENKEIVASGVRVFTKAENPKNKESLALPRTLARSARRRNARKKGRIQQVKHYLSKALGLDLECFVQGEKLATLFQTSKDFLSPWELRERALYRVLDKEELARVILHIAKRRGYDDITYGVEDNDSGKIKKAIAENSKRIKEEQCKTIGEMMYKLYFQKSLNVRNKKESYNRCVGRSELRDELKTIFQIQQELKSPWVNEELIYKLLGNPDAQSKQEREGLIFYQRPLKGFGDKIGKCSHIKKGENSPYRACKHAPSAEEFVALTKSINFLKNLTNRHGLCFSQEDMCVYLGKILQEAQKNEKGLTYSKLKLLLDLPSDFEFLGLDYSGKNPEKAVFLSLPSTFKLNKITQDRKTQDKIANILGANKDWEAILKELESLQLSKEQIQTIKDAKLNFSKHINLSLEALYHLLPLMREGKRYDEGVEILQERGIFSKPQPKNRQLLPPLSELAKEESYFDIPNPVLRRALSEFRKVLNALLEKYGGFHYFHIELTRDVCKAKSARMQLEKINKKNKSENDAASQLLEVLGLPNTYNNRLKCKLWKQQEEYCLYSGEKITIDHLKDQRALQIDHAFPLSRSLDDSQSNKVLCLTSSNQEKSNKTPYEWLGSDEKKWDMYVGRVYSSNFSPSKKRKLTQKNFKERNEEDFLARNLVDTGYIGRVTKEYIKHSLSFLPLPDGKKEHIRIISGSMTSTMRSFWGVQEKNRDHHLHHAQDAIIIACIEPSMIQKYTTYLKDKETHRLKSHQKAQILREGDHKLSLRWPMSNFKDKIQESIQNIIPSHHVSHKVTGELHQETVRTKEFYYQAFGGEEGVKKALKFGKIREINQGIVDNGAMVRVDIFKSKDKGKFYAVPIYTYDFAIGKLPNKAIVQGKKNGIIKDWLEMDENYEFCFSLFKNDCIKIQTKEMQEAVLAIYKSTNSAKATIELEHLSKYALKNEDEEKMFTDTDKEKNKTMTRESCGIQGLKVFQKVKLSVLGEVLEHKPRNRQNIALKTTPKHV